MFHGGRVKGKCMIFEIVIDCCQFSDCMPHSVGAIAITYLRVLVHTHVHIHKHMLIDAHRLNVILICHVAFIIL